MEKVISLFKRNYAGDRLVYDEITPGAEWVIAGEGMATRKLDGTACRITTSKKGGISRRILWKRYDAKKGKTPPPGFEPAQPPDPITGHWPGWIPVDPLNPADKWHCEAVWTNYPDGTYELCGPKIAGNPEGFTRHILIRHGAFVLTTAPRSFAALKEYFKTTGIEGIVWHRANGEMVKIKAKDFGIKRPAPERLTETKIERAIP